MLHLNLLPRKHRMAFQFFFLNKFIDHIYLVLSVFLRQVASASHHHCVILPAFKFTLPAFKFTLLKMWSHQQQQQSQGNAVRLSLNILQFLLNMS
jgi:hypothetical protein